MNRQNARLLSIAGGVVIAIVFVVGLAMVISANLRSSRIVSNILALQKAVRTQNGGATTYLAAVTEATLVRAKRAPEELVNGTTMRSPWGAAIYINGGVDYNGGIDNAFEIELIDTDRSACSDIVNSTRDQFQRITIGGTTVVKDDALGMLPTADSIALACDNDANNIALITAG